MVLNIRLNKRNNLGLYLYFASIGYSGYGKSNIVKEILRAHIRGEKEIWLPPVLDGIYFEHIDYENLPDVLNFTVRLQGYKDEGIITLFEQIPSRFKGVYARNILNFYLFPYSNHIYFPEYQKEEQRISLKQGLYGQSNKVSAKQDFISAITNQKEKEKTKFAIPKKAAKVEKESIPTMKENPVTITQEPTNIVFDSSAGIEKSIEEKEDALDRMTDLLDGLGL